MDFFGIPRGSIRSKALNRLAATSLSVEQAVPTEISGKQNGTVNGSSNGSASALGGGFSGDILKLANAVARDDISSVAITHKELEIIFALAAAAPSLKTEAQASDLLAVLSPYFLESTSQKFKSHASLQLGPSPWDYLTRTLTEAMLTLTAKFPELAPKIKALLKQYLLKFSSGGDIKLSYCFSLLGFMKSLINVPSPFDLSMAEEIAGLFDENFLDSLESVTRRSLEEEHELTYILAYKGTGDEFNSLLFAMLVQKFMNRVLLTLITREFLEPLPNTSGTSLIEYLLLVNSADYDDEPEVSSKMDKLKTVLSRNVDLVETLCGRALTQVNELDVGGTYINLSSCERVDLAMRTKSLALQVLAAGLIVDVVSSDFLSQSIRSTLSHQTEAIDKHVCPVVISIGSLLTFKGHKGVSGDLIHAFPLLVSRIPADASPDLVKEISKCLAFGLKPLVNDSVITTIYSLVNLLVSDNLAAPATALRELRLRSATNTFNSKARTSRANTFQKITSNVTSTTPEKSENSHVYRNAITAAFNIAKVYDSDSITELTVTILCQKFLHVSPELDLYLLEGLADIATSLSEKEFLTLMRLFDGGLSRNTGNPAFAQAIVEARVEIAKNLEGQFNHPLYEVYLKELLASVVSLGDVQSSDHRSQGEISEIALQITRFLSPLAQLLPKTTRLSLLDDQTVILFQNFWFNIVVHGYSETSELTNQYRKELQIIALNSPPLASDSARARAETSFELNPVLRRGSSNHNVKDQKHIISGVSNTNVLELKALSYTKLMFLSATSLLENLRVSIGDCSTILHYFGDPSIAKANIEKFVGSIAISIVQKYTRLATIMNSSYFTSDNVADQLTKVFILCVNRNYDLQDAAFQCASAFLHKLPSSLCNRTALYTLFDLLTAMYDSLLDSERRKYQPKREIFLKHTKAKITVSDSVKWKKSTFEKLHKKAKEWSLLAMNKCSQDMKTLLMSYISDLGLFGKLGDIEYGVSFAVELAGAILPNENTEFPPTIGGKANTMAGFLAEYGWRAQNISTGTSVDVYMNDPYEHPLLTAIRAHKRALSSESEWSKQVGLTSQESREDLSYLLFSEIVVGWQRSIKKHEGLFSTKYDLVEEGFLKMMYVPSDKLKVDYYANLVSKNLDMDLKVILFLLSHFQGTLYQSPHMLEIFTQTALDALNHLKTASLHPFARVVRFQLIRFAIDVLTYHMKIGSKLCGHLVDAILDGVLSWFVQNRPYPFGDNELKIRTDMNALIDVFEQLQAMNLPVKKHAFYEEKRSLALTFLYDEINKIMIWLSPMDPVQLGGESHTSDDEILSFAYTLNPALAFSLVHRFPMLEKHVGKLVTKYPSAALAHHDSVKYLLEKPSLSKYLLLAKAVSPTESINLFRPPYVRDPYVIQYNMRALEAQDINLTFFYVPQIVQGLTHDEFGYVARFIVEVSKVSQKFSHQLIWNLLANSENPELGAQRMIDQIIASYDDDAAEYYQKEFHFFNEVTDISGKLRPYLKNTKAEKKVKIDEEMAKIEVLEGVYLPSNPDGVLIDINRTSGKPLQSHAKTPFMATFKIRKQEMYNGEIITVDKWQSAIFKVGDDVRQDVLALQLVAIFKSVWENAGLDLYCFPNRVTATAPGCGVIDVLPNSISRDMLGREAVNDLDAYFKAKFPDGNLELEDAVQNFVKSLAAYSIISYLLQFKDRHNGNIMYDDKGHILHIDFGFCFDIVPGGVRFEACPFKLTKEMVRVMGGSSDTEYFKMFEELFIKGFLAMRPYHELIIGNVQSMLASGLPCFKGEKTIKNLRGRFYLHKDDKECIKVLKGLIKESYESIFSVGYDKFQKMTNGIPY